VTREDDVRGAVAAALGRFGRIDILVNNAGIMRKAYVKDMPAELWDQVLDVNLKATFLCSKAVLPAMIDAGAAGASSTSRRSPASSASPRRARTAPPSGASSASRARSRSRSPRTTSWSTRSARPDPYRARQAGMAGRRVVEGVGLDKVMARVNSRSPLRRLGTPEQVARMATFIASDDCDFTTGAAFNVDGGIVMG
jgi:NAD(P)-dependent dehydrogenase (short-subunit alcohol dehydrogenase family)